jgi:hypothetical protein
MPIADCGHEVEVFYEDGVAFVPIRCDSCLLEQFSKLRAH